jgi:hypothetical protein
VLLRSLICGDGIVDAAGSTVAECFCSGLKPETSFSLSLSCSPFFACLHSSMALLVASLSSLELTADGDRSQKRSLCCVADLLVAQIKLQLPRYLVLYYARIGFGGDHNYI